MLKARSARSGYHVEVLGGIAEDLEVLEEAEDENTIIVTGTQTQEAVMEDVADEELPPRQRKRVQDLVGGKKMTAVFKDKKAHAVAVMLGKMMNLEMGPNIKVHDIIAISEPLS